MFQISNSTPFPAELLLLPDIDGVDTVFVVIKGTFTISPTVGPADDQVPVTMMDEYFGAPDKSSIRTPSDVSLLKPATDVLLRGSAWAPDSRPVWQMDVSLTVGPVGRTLRVSGDRVWTSGPGGATLSWVAPFVRMPLVWERAFGGSDETNKGPSAYPRNPVGVGFRVTGGTKPAHGLQVPNIEDPAAPISGIADAPLPACFAPIAPHWAPRIGFAGTYDQAWQERRAPYLPADFDIRFFQLAPPGLVAPGHLRGGEAVDARGLSPSGHLQFRLPSIRIATTYLLDNVAHPVVPNLETVLIEPDDNRVVLVWRSALRCDKKARRVNEVVVTSVNAA